ncbi:MAG: hypothetical protein K9M99_01575 [Candidatus Cloacimonetes bacterium]|nr:hypothetical protein [Candidatus Cloacimonadota bacterium]
MKNITREKVIFLLIFVLMVIMVVNASQKQKKYYVFNSSSGKLYKYIKLMPGEKYSWETSAPDSITVISRLITNAVADSQYFYDAVYDGESHKVSRNIRFSNISRGVNGDKVSSWNSYRFYLTLPGKKLVINNSSGHPMLVKVNPDTRKVKKHKTDTDYIAYPPDYYDNSLDILVNDKVYTYYQGNYNGIALDLQGPLNLKIINRLIVDKVENLSFNWKAYLDDKEILEAADSLPYSTSCLADSSSIVTQGKINIINIPKGKHTVKIVDSQPQGILYRLYISKSAVGKK